MRCHLTSTNKPIKASGIIRAIKTTITSFHNSDTNRYSANKPYPSASGLITSSTGTGIGLIASFIINICSALSVLSILTISTLFNSSPAFADYSLSMSSSGPQSIDVIPDNLSGSNVGTSISSDSITISTTCPSGYNFAIRASVPDNKLYLNGSSNNNTAGTYFSPADGSTALKDVSSATWGYYYNGSTVPTKNTAFLAVPSSTSAVATVKTSSSANDTFFLYYGVAASGTMPVGSYKMIPDTNNSNNAGAIVYYATMANSCLPYTVVFNPTSTAGGTTLTGAGTMSNQSMPVGVSTALNSVTYTAPEGYEFNGWNTAQDGTGTSYTNGQSVTDLTAGNNTITLYAQWKSSALPMQTMTLADCMKNVGVNGNAANIGDNIAVYDVRDGNSYTARYINGQCWMTQNLRITGTISSTNSNFTSVSSFDVSQYDLADRTHCGIGSSSDPKGYTNVCSHDSGDPSTGAWYNFAAATAGEITGYQNTASLVQQDICPKNWYIPTGNNTYKYTDFNMLIGNAASGSQNPTTGFSAFGAVAGGYYNGTGNLVGSSTNGGWWSASSGGYYNRYWLSYDASESKITGSGDVGRWYGLYVRCVMRGPSMQDVTDAFLDETMPNEGDRTKLKDARDDKTYAVTKIGTHYVMTQNLAISGTIPAEGSNFTGNNITPAFTTGTALQASYVRTTVLESGWTSVFYNFCLATASTRCTNNNVSWSEATADICPANWKIPSKSQWDAIANATSAASHFGTQLDGYMTKSSNTDNTNYGYYWSTTPNTSDTSNYPPFTLQTNGSTVITASSHIPIPRYYAATIRCIKKQ